MNLLVGTDSGLMLLDRSGHGKGERLGGGANEWAWLGWRAQLTIHM